MSKRKLKLFVDAEVLVIPHFSGIGHYVSHLLRALDELIENRDDIEVTLGVYYKSIAQIKTYGYRNFRIRRSPFSLRTSNGLKTKARQLYYDLLFGKKIYLFPNYTTWPLWRSKMISIVYDLSFELYPQFVAPLNQKFLSSQVKKTAEKSDMILTISKNSQDEISDFYNISKSRITIVYPAVDQSVFFGRPTNQIKSTKARFGIHGDYILFVGNIEPRKNLKNLLLAYEQLDAKIRKKYSLLLVGARGWLDDEIFELIEKLRVKGNHIQQPQGYIEDEYMPAIYSGASAFVYPSLYEGFGIPPIEAMACGTPAITSNNSSLSEAVGDAAVMISSKSVNELSSAITKVLTDEKLREKMIKKGFDQVDSFSWKTSANQLIDVLGELSKQ